MTKKQVVISGATGLIGQALVRTLQARGDAVTVLSRSVASAQQTLPGVAVQQWDARTVGPWAAALNGADAVIHLAGASVAGRWTAAYKQEILDSRVQSARALVAAIEQAEQRPPVLVTASGVDYYGDRGDTPVDERDGPGTGFLPEVCVAWEGEAERATALGARVAAIRTGIVLDKNEGALAKLLPSFKLFAGGPVLPGTQWWSWIHLVDIVGLFLLALDHPEARGGLNGTAPYPERNRDFAATLGKVLGRPSWAPIPLFAVEALIGEGAGPMLVEKQKALPGRALALGYQFKFPRLEPALRDLLK